MSSTEGDVLDREVGRQHRRVLRELAGLAWERELALALDQLAVAFAEWKAGSIGAHELNDRIHEFHHGPSRELYGLYTYQHPLHLVARAVGTGLVRESEVPPEVLAKLTARIASYREDAARLAPQD